MEHPQFPFNNSTTEEEPPLFEEVESALRRRNCLTGEIWDTRGLLEIRVILYHLPCYINLDAFRNATLFIR